jgi:hypothetical protein
MKPTTTTAFIWPGRPTSAQSSQLHGAVERTAGVHGLLSRGCHGRISPIAGQGCRAGAGRVHRVRWARTCLPLFFLMTALPTLLAAQSPPASLRIAPQPACQFDPEGGPEMVVIEGGTFLMGSPTDEKDRADVVGCRVVGRQWWRLHASCAARWVLVRLPSGSAFGVPDQEQGRYCLQQLRLSCGQYSLKETTVHHEYIPA